MSADPEISCPPIRSQLSAHPDLRVSVGSELHCPAGNGANKLESIEHSLEYMTGGTSL